MCEIQEDLRWNLLLSFNLERIHKYYVMDVHIVHHKTSSKKIVDLSYKITYVYGMYVSCFINNMMVGHVKKCI